MNFASLLKNYWIVILFFIILVGASVTQSQMLSLAGFSECGTSPYNDFKSKYCRNDFNNPTGKIQSVARSITLQPLILVYPWIASSLHLYQDSSTQVTFSSLPMLFEEAPFLYKLRAVIIFPLYAIELGVYDNRPTPLRVWPAVAILFDVIWLSFLSYGLYRLWGWQWKGKALVALFMVDKVFLSVLFLVYLYESIF